MIIKDPSTILELRAAGVYVYDFSSISWFINCPRAFQFRHEMGLSLTTTTTSYSLEFGRCIHKALQHWYINRDDDSTLLLFANEFKPSEEAPTLSPKTGKELDATYTVLFGCSLLAAYFDKYRADNFKLLQNEEPVAEELEPGVFVAGRIDKIIDRRNRIIYIDHKTSKYPDKYQVNPSPQFMGYKYLCEKLTGQHVSGELDMLGVSKTKDLTTLLRREPFDYTAHQMNEWRRSLSDIIDHISKCRVANYWPQYWNCHPFFRDCAYIPICTLARAEERDSLIANLYIQKFWDPFSVED